MIEQKDTTSKLKEFRRKYRQELRFVLLFTTLLVGFFMLINNKTVADNVVLPITVAETYVASLVLNTAWVGYPIDSGLTCSLAPRATPFAWKSRTTVMECMSRLFFWSPLLPFKYPGVARSGGSYSALRCSTSLMRCAWSVYSSLVPPIPMRPLSSFTRPSGSTCW